MDWAESDDLLEIFSGEVDERCAALTRGADDLASGDLSDDRLEELVRHAHTVKGSAHMMGRVEIGNAAATLERAWRAVRERSLRPDTRLAAAMGDVARLMPGALRGHQATEELEGATTRLLALLEGEDPTSGIHVLPERETAPPPGTNGGTLGGLLASIEEELSGAVTRVDTGDLYRLINRAVEIGLDSEALADLTHVAFEGADPTKLVDAWRSQLERLADDVAELQSWAVSLANVPFGDTVDTFPQFVRFLGRRLGKEVRFEATGTDVLVDRQIVDALREPLRHLVVNAVDHGVETAEERARLGKQIPATVRLTAGVEEGRLVIAITDDGRGIDWSQVEAAASSRGLGTEPSELRGFLFWPGFTTVSVPNDFSGTGEGLALVADAVDRLGGSVTVDSTAGVGTTIRLDLPVSLVLQNVVVVACGDQFFGIAEPAVLGSVSLETGEDRPPRTVAYQGEDVPVISFAKAMAIPLDRPEPRGLLLSTRYGLVVVAVSEVVDRRRVAVKNLGPILKGAEHLTGAAFLGGGQVLVVVDHSHLGAQARRPDLHPGRRDRVLVVDDSAGVRQLIGATLRGSGYEVDVAPSVERALSKMEEMQFDALVVDYSMPDSDGVELVRHLRGKGVTLPIVMVSAVATEEDKATAWDSGVDAYIDKYDLRQGALSSALARLLAARGEEDGR